MRKRILISIFSLLLLILSLSNRVVYAAPMEQTAGVTVQISLVNNKEQSARPGQTLQYEIIIKNTTNVTQKNVTILDEFTPEAFVINKDKVAVYSGTRLTNIAPGYGDANINWVLGDMSSNAELRIEYEVTVSDIFTLNSNNTEVIENTATLKVDGVQADSDYKTLNVVTITIEKNALGDGVVRPSAGLEMELQLSNNTDVNFDLVKVNDIYVFPSEVDTSGQGALEKRVTIIGVTIDSPGSWKFQIVNGGPSNDDYILWEIGPLASRDSVTINYTIQFDLKPGEKDVKLLNNANVYTEFGFMAQTGFPEELLLTEPLPEIKLTRRVERLDENEKPSAGEIRLGDTARFTIDYVNEGAMATHVVIEDQFSENVFAENSFKINPEDRGRRDGTSKIVWDLGNLQAGDSGSVWYEVKLKEGLFAGDNVTGDEKEFTHTATIYIDSVKQAEIQGQEISFTVRQILKLNEISINDKNGGDIEPGDTLQVTIPIENKGDSNASDIRLQVQYDQIENLNFDNLGQGELDEADGVINWKPELVPGENTIVFDLLLPSKVEDTLSFGLNVTISRNETALARTSKSVTIEPIAVTQTSSGTASVPSSQANFILIFSLVVALIISAFTLLGFLAKYLAKTNGLNNDNLRDLVEMFTIVVIISTLLVLSMVTTIGENAAVGILSGIAGYVLGSRATRGLGPQGGGPQSEGRSSQPSGSPADGGPEGIAALVKAAVQDALKDMVKGSTQLPDADSAQSEQESVDKAKTGVQDTNKKLNKDKAPLLDEEAADDGDPLKQGGTADKDAPPTVEE